MPNTFFTSDTHFSHVRCALEFRKFSSVEEHDETIIQNWNSVVKPNDTVYHLGDVAMGKFVESIKLVDRLNGTKHLILGNHDRLATRYGYSEKERQKRLVEYASRFETIQYEKLIVCGLGEVLLQHFPTDGDHTEEERFKEFRPTLQPSTSYLFHGHIHDLRKRAAQQINVGVDVWGFTPVELSVIERLLQAT